MGQTATGGVLFLFFFFFFLPLADKEQATGQLAVWGRTQEEGREGQNPGNFQSGGGWGTHIVAF